MAGLVPIGLITAAFFATALLYASVGFGGGSTYAALLALSGLDYRILPLIALACNIVVVAGSTVRFAGAGVMPWRGAITVTTLAAPAALLGGLTPITEGLFFALLGASLLLTGATMALPQFEGQDSGEPSQLVRYMPLFAAPLGYLAGVVGIGGGIFLAPLLHLTHWREPRAIAATASFFILVNSLFGLAGQMLKRGPDAFAGALYESLPLLIAVAIGGQIGSLMALKYLPQRIIRWLTAALVTVVGARLLLGV
ncbi:MAG: sulfite exporter TauE/SafE family protein [Altererythrobacter sp.]|nr:sulfite exporter TauE/SafE family protein [uncultured Altererythrobacter sp.]MBT8432968.1 sulfite exporter TauE/SafE family protein [Altererythrobacter sp.]NNE49695.1 sulfite exporter TauE/SafE family protein [Altererythrobacter sp.]NNF93588.1 sulfite exporter TauE/SafE family protein [Altererythrobacter sp.]NNK46377.1 sulfite exporter TauE/SafE family protein [Altererythrobacter sp.]